MFIKDLAKCRYFQAADNTCICELLHPVGMGGPSFQHRHAVLQPGAASLSHKLKNSSEVYFIFGGEGEMHIDSEKAAVRAGQAILIPPGFLAAYPKYGKLFPKIYLHSQSLLASDDEVVEEDKWVDKVKKSEKI